MELSKNYIPGEVEIKWYKHWVDSGYFHSTPNDKKAYTVVIPPPNVTGVLHMGHCLNNTIQDILVRRARMQGFNPCWVPGTDHASIATEAKVVAMLRERGIAKSSLTRDEFLSYAWEWKEKYGGIILQQLRKMGCSLDWERTSFTMDADYYESVIKVFVDLYKKGKIYRGKRMINWDVRAKTALSDEEVIHKEVAGKIYHLRYKLDVPGEEYITIATVRPETILGDSAICVHPKDDRYKHLVGKFAFVPLINRRIPIIADDYVEIEFGTGALKVTGGIGAYNVYATNLFDSGNRVITSVTVSPGNGLAGGGTITGPSGTVTLNNTGVLSLSGSSIAVWKYPPTKNAGLGAKGLPSAKGFESKVLMSELLRYFLPKSP